MTDPGSDRATPNDNDSSNREDDAHAWAHLRDEGNVDDKPGANELSCFFIVRFSLGISAKYEVVSKAGETLIT